MSLKNAPQWMRKEVDENSDATELLAAVLVTIGWLVFLNAIVPNGWRF